MNTRKVYISILAVLVLAMISCQLGGETGADEIQEPTF